MLWICYSNFNLKEQKTHYKSYELRTWSFTLNKLDAVDLQFKFQLDPMLNKFLVTILQEL